MVRVRQKQSENEKAGSAETNSAVVPPPPPPPGRIAGGEKKNDQKTLPDRNDLDGNDQADPDDPVQADGDDDDWTPDDRTSKKLQATGSLVGNRKSTRARKPLVGNKAYKS